METKKKYSPERYRNHRVQISLNDTEWVKLQLLASHKKTTKNDFIRYVIDRLYNQIKPV
jgi:hypothetical protein